VYCINAAFKLKTLILSPPEINFL